VQHSNGMLPTLSNIGCAQFAQKKGCTQQVGHHCAGDGAMSLGGTMALMEVAWSKAQEHTGLPLTRGSRFLFLSLFEAADLGPISACTTKVVGPFPAHLASSFLTGSVSQQQRAIRFGSAQEIPPLHATARPFTTYLRYKPTTPVASASGK
jgi:hypothetical protein